MAKRPILTTSDWRAAQWKAERETAFQTRVTNMALSFGWGPIYHTHLSIHSQRGYPDLHMLRGPRSLFAELKSMRGVVSDDQKKWIAALQAAGHEAYVWYPCDTDAIEAILKGERP